MCEHQTHHLQLVREYRHLGGQQHHTGDHAKEMRVRAGIAYAAFNQHRRLLYHTPHIESKKKIEPFDMLVMTKFLYGSESWLATDQRSMKRSTSQYDTRDCPSYHMIAT